MRVVFAGTPEVAVPALDAVAASRHELVGVVTRPDAPAGRGRRLVASPVAQRAAELGVAVLKPDRPRDPDFQAALRGARPGLLPGRGLRRAAAPVGPRLAAARLGEPALLGAPALAWRGAGAARDLGRRRGHRGDHLPDRQGARRRPDLRRDDPDDPARRHRRGPARPSSPRAAPVSWWRPWTASRTVRWRRGPSRRKASATRRRCSVEDAHVRLGGPRARCRSPDPGVHAGAGRVDDLRRRADEARARSSVDRDATRCLPVCCEVTKNAVHVGTGTRRSGSAR